MVQGASLKTNLLIVESPSKAKRLAAVLGQESGWVVAATYGDLMDLPSGKLAIRIAAGKLRLSWRTTRAGRKHLTRIRKAARTVRKCGGRIYVATAPDRDGEILAAHIMQCLQLPERTTPRLLLQSLEPEAIKRAIARPGRLDFGVVAAQEARRGLDRAVGFGLAKRIGKPISRVQALVLKACADQAAARSAFRPSIRYRAGFMVNQTFFSLPEEPMLSEREALQAAKSKPARRVVSRMQKRELLSPPAACATMDVLGAFSGEAGLVPIVASMKSLFADGLITFPMTESRTLDPDWFERARTGLGANGGSQPSGCVDRQARARCEAIRPTSTTWSTPASLEKDDGLKRRVYDYIAWRAFASCAKPAQERTVRLVLDNRATSTLTREIVDGWRRYDPNRQHGAASESDPVVWSLKEDDPIEAVPWVDYLHAPRPSAPTVAWLINWMEKTGVGKPSTYAPCLRKMIDRKLVSLHPSEGLIPTRLGLSILGTLSGVAERILRPDYARALEEWLDDIAQEDACPEEGARLVLAGVQLLSGASQNSLGIDNR